MRAPPVCPTFLASQPAHASSRRKSALCFCTHTPVFSPAFLSHPRTKQTCRTSTHRLAGPIATASAGEAREHYPYSFLEVYRGRGMRRRGAIPLQPTRAVAAMRVLGLLMLKVLLQLSTPVTAFQAPAPWRVRHAPLRSVTMATPNSASQQKHDNGNEALLSIVIERAASHTILPGALATHGRLLKNSNSQPVTFIPPNEEISFNLVAGRNAATQEPVLAFVGPSAATSKPGAELRVPAGAVLSRPASLSLEECALLPYHAVSLLPPLMRAGIHGGEGSSGPASSKVCIVTGCGPAAIFAVQVLRAWGCRVVGVSRRNPEVLTKAGAEEVVDCRTTSFSEQVPNFAAVIDTVGTDTETLAANLLKFKDAAYVSTMPSATRRMQAKGLLQAASTFASVFWGKPDLAPTNVHWLPEKLGLEVISYVLKLAEAKHLTMPLTPPTLDDYMDGVVWARDSETQARFGFPAPVAEEGLTDALVSRFKERMREE